LKNYPKTRKTDHDKEKEKKKVIVKKKKIKLVKINLNLISNHFAFDKYCLANVRPL
jgi:hypothetical protein